MYEATISDLLINVFLEGIAQVSCQYDFLIF